MSPVWAVPVLVMLLGGVGLVALLRVTSESARELAAEIARFGEAHAALARLRTEAQVGARHLHDLRDR